MYALSDFSLSRIPAKEDRGVPFFTFSDILEWDPAPTMYLSRKYEVNLDSYIVQEGWILLSRAGTIGNTMIVGPELAGKAIANHAIRIVPKNHEFGFLIYLLLSGSVGRQVISSLSYGAVVDVIKPAQLENIPIPKLEHLIMSRLASIVSQSMVARSQAIELLSQAKNLVMNCNYLKQLSNYEHLEQQAQPEPECFSIHSSSVTDGNISGSEYRLDAHYYNPTAKQAVANIKNCGAEVKTVGEVAERVLMGPRFKRNYVESDHGVPFLSGKNIVQIRPTNLNYLSNLQISDMEELIVKRGWTLVTCSGTIGRTCFVWENYEEYAASQHILRVIPDESKIDSGYLYAFLSSRYGYEQILRYRHGSVIDEVTDKQIERVLVPCPSRKDQEAIGNIVREAYEKRAEAIRLEDEAQEILMNELTKAQGVKGV